MAIALAISDATPVDFVMFNASLPDRRVYLSYFAATAPVIERTTLQKRGGAGWSGQPPADRSKDSA
jgi:hypothetical protein